MYQLSCLDPEREGSLAVVTLNRPERRNALSLDLMLRADRLPGRDRRNREVRAVILAAAGKVFSSGHDLNELVGGTIADYRRIFDVCTQLMAKIQSIPQPVIAQVQGIATAAGCQLVATCDLAVAQRGGDVRHAGREEWAVLLDAHGRVDARGGAQARHGDAADRQTLDAADARRSGDW